MKNLAYKLINKESVVGYRFRTFLGVYDVSIEDIKDLAGINTCGIIPVIKFGNKYISKDEFISNEVVEQIDSVGVLLRTLIALVDDSGLGFTMTAGDSLLEFFNDEEENGFKNRYCLEDLTKFLGKRTLVNFFILYGLRRTGKTVLIKQAIKRLLNNGINADSIVFISIKDKNSLRSTELKDYVSFLIGRGVKYLFIDEVTFVEGDFGWLAAFTNTTENFKIVLSGTYSSSFIHVKGNSLFDRCIVMDTSYVSFEEYNMLFPDSTILEYIENGAILKSNKGYVNSHKNLNFPLVLEVYKEYLSTSIIDNIFHSFENLDFDSRYPELCTMYWEDKKLLSTMIFRWLRNYGKDLLLGFLNNDKFVFAEVGISGMSVSGDRKLGASTDLFINRLKDRLDEIWGIEKYKYSKSQLYELRDFMRTLNILVGPTYTGKYYLVPTLLRVGCLVDVLTLLENEYEDLIKETGILTDVEVVKNNVKSSVEGMLIESVYEVDLLKHGVECSKLKVDEGEIDLVIDDNYYELKRSDRFRKSYARWLLNEKIRNKGTLNVVGNFEERIIKLSEKESLKGCSKNTDVLERLENADEKLYDIHIKNINNLLIGLTRGKKVLRLSTIGGIADYRL